MNWLTQVIAVSQDVEQSIRKYKSSLKAPLQTILNGVNTEHFRPGNFTGEEVRRQYNIPADAPVVGTIAVFRFQKRLDLWLQIAAGIRKEIPTAHFILVGDGPLKELVLSKCRELGLDEAVHFTGVQTEVRPYLAAFDLYMMSSVFEGLPIALLEAMASGCAVVSTDAGGIKEVIRHEQDGLLCGVDEADKLKTFAVRLLGNNQEREQFSAAGRKRVEDVFSLKYMVKELETVYRKEARL
jgi:glycosyltransferase involved in cell wall biosynthesis